jgi:hypothetical protein
MGTKNNPGNFDCYQNAHPDEPMFVLLGRDPLAGLLVRLWAEARATLGETSEEKLSEAYRCADAMGAWALGERKSVAIAKAALHHVMLARTDGKIRAPDFAFVLAAEKEPIEKEKAAVVTLREIANTASADGSLGTALPREMARVRDHVLPAYIKIGPAGAFGLSMIRATLDEATRALAEGDVVAMLRLYLELKEIQA